MGVITMKKKALSAFIVAMLGSLPGFSSSLVINLTDGTEIVCSLAKEPQMLFGEKSITLTSLVGEVGQWNFSDVESWQFSDRLDQDEIDAIDKLKAMGYEDIEIKCFPAQFEMPSFEKVEWYSVIAKKL